MATTTSATTAGEPSATTAGEPSATTAGKPSATNAGNSSATNAGEPSARAAPTDASGGDPVASSDGDPVGGTPGERRLRADAQRNHDRILAAAGDAFAEQGLEVSMEEIARRAGVGAATLYRRFPSKQELLRAILDARLRELEPQIAAAAAAADAWEGLLAGMGALLEAQARSMDFVQLLAQAGELSQFKRELGQRVFEPLGALFARAQDAGQVRRDLQPSELHILVRMVGTTAWGAAARPNWERYLTLLADALRTPAPSALPPL